MRNGSLFATSMGLFVLACVMPASADVIPTEFHDQDHNLLTGLAVLVIREDGSTQKLAPEVDGVYDIVAEPGEKLAFRAADGGAFFRGAEGRMPVTIEQNVVFGLVRQASDDCLHPTEIVPGTPTPGSTVGAPDSPEAGDFCGTSIFSPNAGQWYQLIGTGNRMTASVCNDGDPATGGADYDTKISIFCHDCSALTCVDGNDDASACADFTSSVTWCSQPGTPYLIFVHGFRESTGNFDLVVTEGTPCDFGVLCSIELFTGACCTCRSFDVCRDIECADVTPGECEAVGGLFAGLGVDCTVPSGTQEEFVGTFAPVPIPDNDPAGASVTLDVGADILIRDVDADVLITHAWIGDLAVFLESPGGTTVQLWSRNCGDSSAIDVLFDDEGTQTFCGPTGAPTTGSIPPGLPNGFTSFMRDFDGENAEGTWTLSADDNFTLDAGTIHEFTLLIEAGISNCEPLCPDVVCTVECVEIMQDEDHDDHGSEDSDDAGSGVLGGEGRTGGFDGILDFSLTREDG